MFNSQQDSVTHPRRTRQSLLAIVGLLLLLRPPCDCGVVFADETDTRVRRIFVPADQPQQWPDGDWIPIRPEVLQRLLKTPQSTRSKTDSFEFSSAQYHATFNPVTQRLEAGSALLTLARRHQELIEFEPFNLAVSAGRIRGSNANNSESSDSTLGSHTGERQTLYAPSAVRQIEFDWSLEGHDRLNGVEFSFEVPRSVVTTFAISVPPEWQIVGDAVTSYIAPDSSGPGQAANAASDDALVSWIVAPGSQREFQLRIQPASSRNQDYPTANASYRLNSRYRMRSNQLDQIFELSLSRYSRDRQEVVVAIAPELIVSAVEHGSGRAVSWRDSGERNDGWHVLHIDLPAQLTRTDQATTSHELTIRGSQTIDHGKSSDAIQLILQPPIATDAALLDGRLSIYVESPHSISTYSLTGLRQTATSSTDDDSELTFHQFKPDCRVALDVQRSGKPSQHLLTIRQFAVLHAERSPEILEAEMEISAQSRNVFETSWLFPREWEVTSITTESAAAQSTGNVNGLAWDVTQHSDSHQRIVIEFADGLPTRRPVKLIVKAQRADQVPRNSIPVPIVLPEHALSAEVVLALTGQSSAAQTDISGELFQPVAELSSFENQDWARFSGSSSDELSAIWSATWWNGLKEALAAQLEFSNPTDGTDGEITPAKTDGPGEPVQSDSEDPNGDQNDQSSGASADATGTDLASTESQSPQEGTVRPSIVTAEFESFLSPGSVGRDLHWFRWRFLYSTPVRPLRFSLPPGSELLQATWRGEPIALSTDDDGWIVPLSMATSEDELAVQYTVPSQAVYLRETYRCRIPSSDATVVEFRWNIHLRKRYSAVSLSNEVTPEGSLGEESMLKWFFGPLARENAGRVFDPFRRSDWEKLVYPVKTGTEWRRLTADRDGVGWRSLSATTTGLPPSLAIHVCDKLRLDALSWFVLFLSTLVGVLMRAAQVPRRNNIALVWLCGCLSSAMLVPSAYAELVGAALLGSVLATLLPRFLVRPVRNDEATVARISMASTVSMQRVIPLIGAACLTLQFSAPAQAQDDRSESDSSIDILIPYQKSAFESDNPEYVLIQNEQFNLLSDMTQTAPESKADVLITQSRWTMSVSHNDRVEIDAVIKAAVRHGADAELEIPVPARFLAGRSECLVDGRMESVLPSSDGLKLRIPLNQSPIPDSRPPGSRPAAPPAPESINAWTDVEINISFRPLIVRSEFETRAVMPIPRVAQTHVTLNFESAPAALFVGDSSKSRKVSESTPLEFDTGPVNQLLVRWRQQDSSEPPAENIPAGVDLRSVVELNPTWLRHRTLARYSLDGQTMRYVTLKLPPGAQIDPDFIDSPGVADTLIDANAERILLTIELDPPRTASFDIDIPWQQFPSRDAKDSYIQWAVPVNSAELETAMPLSSHIAGVSAAAGFQLSASLLDNTGKLTDDADFLSLWETGNPPRPPQLTFRISDANQLSRNVIPLQIQRSVRQSQIARVEPGGIEWTVIAEVETSTAPAFYHEFAVPDNLQVVSVTVLADDVDRLSHWSHRNGRLFLHLRDRQTGIQNVTIHGHQQIRGRQNVPVPFIQAVDSRTVESTLQVSRSPLLQVTVENVESIGDELPAPSEVTKSSNAASRYRLVPGQTATLDIQRVRKDATASTAARVTSNESGDLALSVEMQLQDPVGRFVRVRLPEWPITDGLPIEAHADHGEVGINYSPVERLFTLELPRTRSRDVKLSFTVPLAIRQKPVLAIEPPTAIGFVNQSATISIDEDIEGWKVLPFVPVRINSDGNAIGSEQSTPAVSNIGIWSRATRLLRDRSRRRRLLPDLVLHELHPGIRHSGVSVTRLLLTTSEDVVDVTWPNEARLIAARINGQLESILPPVNGRLRLPLLADSEEHDVELLWDTPRSKRQMKIQRRNIRLPQLESSVPQRTFIVALPAAGIRLLDTAPEDDADHRTFQEITQRWGERAETIPGDGTTGSLSAQLQDMIIQIRNIEAESAISSSSFASDSVGVFRRVAAGEISLWVIDRRLDGILASILVVVILLPLIAAFLALSTGDRLAQQPAVSFLLLGLIWWLCLKGSGAGFVLGTIAGSFLAFAHFRKKQPMARPATS